MASTSARLRWLLFGLITQLHLSRAQTAVSTLFVPDLNTTISINLPPGSDDINFYMSAPDWYQWAAVGFGQSMSDALMLVMYASANHKGVTVSPRLSRGNTEPVWDAKIHVTLDQDSTTDDGTNKVANGTCHGCRALRRPGAPSIAATTAAPMMFAVGQSLDLSSDDPDARIRRHLVYAQFTMDLVQATGPGGIGFGVIGSNTSGAALVGGGLVRDSNKAAAAHGILYAIAALGVAPIDSLVARTLGRRLPGLHAFTASLYFGFVIGAMVPGILTSREQVETQQFRTPHQVLGLLTVVVVVVMLVWGIALSFIKRSAKRRLQEPPENTRRLGSIHRWLGYLVWLLLLVNVGVGMKLSQHTLVLILAYGAVALGLVVLLIPVYFCIWWCSERRNGNKDGDALHELHTIYDHHH